jgi:hypothetical protein
MVSTDYASVPVQSAWYSKINWTQIAPAVATGLTWVGVKDVSADQLLVIFSGVSALAQVATVIFRTFFNATVPPTSLPAR